MLFGRGEDVFSSMLQMRSANTNLDGHLLTLLAAADSKVYVSRVRNIRKTCLTELCSAHLDIGDLPF